MAQRRAAGIAALFLFCAAGAQARPSPKTAKAPKLLHHDEVAGGWHWRIQTDHGPVHVWRPARYDSRSAGTVVYVHGLFNTVDEAFRQHKLAEQFAESRQNALYILPEAPTAGADPPNWNSLAELFSTVWEKTHLTPPRGPLVLVGHSAAYRTIVQWLTHPAIAEIILLDALYGDEDEYANWLNGHPGRMALVARGTTKWTEPFIKRFKRVAVRNAIPESYAAFTKRERGAKLLYLRSQYGHMEIVTEGRTIPVLLRRTALRHFAERPPKIPQAAPVAVPVPVPAPKTP